MAAAYLARAGRSVLVLERRDHVGGAAVSERPWPGVDARLSRYSYLVSLMPRALREELGLHGRDAPALGLVLLAAAGRQRAAGARRASRRTPNWAAFQEMTGAGGAGRVPVADRAAGLARRAARAGRRRRGLGGAGRAAAGGDAGAPLRGRPRARDRRHRRADRHVRGARRRVAAPEPLLPLPRDRQRHGRLGRAGRRDGRGHRRARGDRLGGGRGGAARASRSPGSRPTASAPRCTSTAARWRRATCSPTCAPAVLARLLGEPPPDDPAPEGAQLKLNMLLSRLPRLRDESLDPREAFAGTFHVNESATQLAVAYAEAHGGRVPQLAPCEIYCHSLTDPVDPRAGAARGRGADADLLRAAHAGAAVRRQPAGGQGGGDRSRRCGR